MWRPAVQHYSCGNSLLPMTVSVIPTCTLTGLPATSTVILLPAYQPMLPVLNSFTSTTTGWPAMDAVSGLALPRNSERVTGQVVRGAVADMVLSPWCGYCGQTPRSDVPRGVNALCCVWGLRPCEGVAADDFAFCDQ